MNHYRWTSRVAFRPFCNIDELVTFRKADCLCCVKFVFDGQIRE